MRVQNLAEKASKKWPKGPKNKAKTSMIGTLIPDPDALGPLILDPAVLPVTFLSWLNERSHGIEFADLRTEFVNRVRALSALDAPSNERRTRFIIDQSRGENVADDQLFWAHHNFPGDDLYTKALRRFQSDLANSGFVDWAKGSAPHPKSLAAGALAALDRKEFSGALFDAWFMLGVLLGRQKELEAQEAGNAVKFVAGVESAAIGSKDMQKIWLARWLLTNCKILPDDRGEELGRVEDLCKSIARGHRASPNPKHWPPAWFAGLLNKGELVKWVDESEAKLRALAGNRLVPNPCSPLFA